MHNNNHTHTHNNILVFYLYLYVYPRHKYLCTWIAKLNTIYNLYRPWLVYACKILVVIVCWVLHLCIPTSNCDLCLFSCWCISSLILCIYIQRSNVVSKILRQIVVCCLYLCTYIHLNQKMYLYFPVLQELSNLC